MVPLPLPDLWGHVVEGATKRPQCTVHRSIGRVSHRRQNVATKADTIKPCRQLTSEL